MFACYWVAVEPDTGRCYVYREFCQSNMIVGDAAQAILDNTLPGEKVTITFAPPDMWNRQKDSGKSMAELFMLNGVGIVKSNNNRVQGHLQVKQMLADLPDEKPGLVFFDTCKHAIGDLQCIQADENNPSDCAKNPHDVTHTVDAVRYFCISRVLGTEATAEPVKRYDDELDEQQEDYGAFMTGGAVSASYLSY
jgi:phage terminase large subunit